MEFFQEETVASTRTQPWQVTMRSPDAVLDENCVLQVNGVLGSSIEQRLQRERMIDNMIAVDLRLFAKQNDFVSQIDERFWRGTQGQG